MAKTSKATRGSKPKVRSAAPTRPSAKKQPVKAKPLAVRSAPAKPRAVRTRALESVAPLATTSALLAQLRADEQRAVQQALSGKSVLLEGSPRARDAALFTSAALIAKRPVLVASPLAAELFEQASRVKGLEVVTFASFTTEAARAAAKKRVLRGGNLLVVIEPAQLFSAELRQLAIKAPFSLVGIAAAHACSEHAHELSPAYLSLRQALGAFSAPVLATATRTTPRVIEQVAEAIGAGKAIIAARPLELSLAGQVVRASERKAQLVSAIQGYGAPGVVLTATSQEAEAVASELSARGVACVRLHSGMAPVERSEALARFSEPSTRLVLVTQSPHANASGLAGCPETAQGLGSSAPRADLRFVIHYQAPLSLEQHFEDLAWLPAGGHSLVLSDSSDAALVQAILAQQRIKPAAIEAMAQALAQASEGKAALSDNLALRAGTSRRSAERVLFAFAERTLIVRDSGQVSRLADAATLAAEGRLLSMRFAALRAADTARAEAIAQYVTSRHGSAPAAPSTTSQPGVVARA
jgi:superfamily II DNA helicase RecQ